MNKNLKTGLVIAGVGVFAVIALKMYNDRKAASQDDGTGETAGADGTKSGSVKGNSEVANMLNSTFRKIRSVFHP